MKYFLDSAKLDEIKLAYNTFGIDGVTTNPRHIMLSGKPFLTAITDIANWIKEEGLEGYEKFPVSVEINPHLDDTEEMIAAANLNLRTVERVMLLLARYKATTFDELFDGVYSIPWEEFLPADAAFPVTGSSLNSQLTSIPACQSVIKKAVVKRLMKGHRTTVLPESGVEYKVRFMLRKNVCEIMLDTTGEGLHKRGYRRNSMEAPIRETLAATIADLGRVRRDSLVEDS